jgi:hypothetical protein
VPATRRNSTQARPHHPPGLQSLPFNALWHNEMRRDAPVYTEPTTGAGRRGAAHFPLPSISIALRLASLSPWM